MQKHHMHRFTMAELDTFNSSHIINKLAFGEGIPGVQNPLDGYVLKFILSHWQEKHRKGNKNCSSGYKKIFVFYHCCTNAIYVCQRSSCVHKSIQFYRTFHPCQHARNHILATWRLFQIRYCTIHCDATRKTKTIFNVFHLSFCANWRVSVCVVIIIVQTESTFDSAYVVGGFVGAVIGALVSEKTTQSLFASNTIGTTKHI